jgi:hypothetical protein
MKYIAALLAVLISTPASAECYPVKEGLRSLLEQQFIPVAEFEVEHKPTMMFVNPHHEYLVVQYEDSETLCVVGGGTAFYLLRERKV